MRSLHKDSSSAAHSQRTNFLSSAPIATVKNSPVSSLFLLLFFRTTIVSIPSVDTVVIVDRWLIVVFLSCIQTLFSFFWIPFWVFLWKLGCCCSNRHSRLTIPYFVSVTGIQYVVPFCSLFQCFPYFILNDFSPHFVLHYPPFLPSGDPTDTTISSSPRSYRSAYLATPSITQFVSCKWEPFDC